jgi:hypothetical protein
MNRRFLLAGLFALPVSLPAEASLRSYSFDTFCSGNIPCWERGNTVYTYNKIGIPVSYTKELASDLKIIHNLDAKNILQNMYGSSFSINKKIIKNKNKLWLKFTIISDDIRDKEFSWYLDVS